ncbi:MAG TPA: hypothetical protein VL172_19910 [Kofleriaceae bacterium]|nr:hypothetical protein [Kofleriaceae bacterium]
MKAAGPWLALAAALAAPAAARAQPDGEPPPSPRIFHVPTAWLQPPAHLYASAGANHRGSGMFALSAGVGRLAEVDAELTDRFVQCATVCSGDDRDARHGWVVSALFKVGVAERRLGWWQPALALGFRRSLRSPGADPGDRELGLAEMYAAASLRLGGLQLHGGGELWDAASPGGRLERGVRRRLRPFAGLGWRPPLYPRTTLLADLGWVPELPIAAAGEELRWLAGWGIRYQAFGWGSIELAVRHRQGESIGGATVFVRVNASGSLRAASAGAAGRNRP